MCPPIYRVSTNASLPSVMRGYQKQRPTPHLGELVVERLGMPQAPHKLVLFRQSDTEFLQKYGGGSGGGSGSGSVASSTKKKRQLAQRGKEKGITSKLGIPVFIKRGTGWVSTFGG